MAVPQKKITHYKIFNKIILTLHSFNGYLTSQMKIFMLILLTPLLLLFAFSSSASSFDGPLQVKNLFPLFLHVNTPNLEKASVENSFSADLLHSSIYMVRNSPEWSVNLDMEISGLDIRFRKKISDSLEFGIDVPVLSFNSGFMDNFLKSYHKAFGFPDYGRSNRPDNEFLYEVRRNGELVVKGKDGKTGIGDIRLSVKKVVLNNPVISLKAAVELPTGKSSGGFGNGSLDGGVAVLIEHGLSKKVKLYFNSGAVFPGDLKAEKNVKLKNFVYAGTGLEAFLWDNLSILGQVYAQSSIFPKTKISTIDRTPVILTLGGRYYSGKNSIEFSFTEDPNTSGAPDLSFGLSYKRKF